MATEIFDVIVIGTGAGGGTAIASLCQAGARVCALNAGRRLNPRKDFRNHRQPYDMRFRGFDDPAKRDQRIGFMDNEYTDGIWEHEIAFTKAPGTEWTWRRCFAVGGKTNFWGRSSARFGDIDFRAGSRDGFDVDWPVSYTEMSPFYSRIERMIGVASTVQHRPSNPDGEYLPPIRFRCIDRILEAGASKIGIPYVPDRIAQLTRPHNGHPPCHYCGNCMEGCEIGAFFSTPSFFLPAAEKSGKLDLRTNALVRSILVDDRGRAKGVAYVDRHSKQEREVFGKAVVLAASCVESARIVLNSRSRYWPKGIGNSSLQAGRNLCDHLYGTAGRGFFPQLLGQPSFPDNVSASTVAWMPRWQNLNNPREERFIRGYSVYPDAGCSQFPWYFEDLPGFGRDFKREVKRRYPTPISFYIQAPSQRDDANFVDIDPEVKDRFGIPVARLHFKWDENALLMWEHGKHACEQLLRKSGAEYLGFAPEPDVPGTSLHETGTLRMGDDRRKFFTNRFGQSHEVPNLYICDASIFPNCTDKTTTLSILAFSLRTSEYLIRQLKRG